VIAVISTARIGARVPRACKQGMKNAWSIDSRAWL
jgi:hypothetical protein